MTEAFRRTTLGQAPRWLEQQRVALSGGTRIGHCLHHFLDHLELRSVQGPDAIALILSDGWDVGDADLLNDGMRRLRRQLGRIVWWGASLQSVITCVVEYVIDPAKIDAFERFAQRWMELVSQHGGTHHGYFLPAEGASDQALALFSFPSLAAYEQYRTLFGTDPEFAAADRIRDESGCVLRYQRTFMRPLLPG